MKIYTKTGDEGQTSLFSGKRVAKDSSYVASYGEVDELNSFLGWAVSVAPDDHALREKLIQIQHDLHQLCSDLATPSDATVAIPRFEANRTQRVESWIDEMQTELEPLKQFILPGGSELSARLHICRTIARRAERAVVAHGREEELNAETGVYLNRVSDFLFVAARYANKISKKADVPWDKAK